MKLFCNSNVNFCSSWMGMILSEISLTRPEHSAYVGVSFVKTLLDDGVDEWRSVEEHSLVALVVILFGNLPTTVGISVKGT